MFLTLTKTITILVALVVLLASVTTVHSFSRLEPGSQRADGQKEIEVDTDQIYREANQSASGYKPIAPITNRRRSRWPQLQLLGDLGYKPTEPITRAEIVAIIFPTSLLEPHQLSRYRLGKHLDKNNQNSRDPLHSATTTCTVTTPADSGEGSLRQCLLDVAPSETINFDPQAFPPSVPVSITLSSPLPWITTNGLMIDGSNAGVILDGSALSEGAGLVIDGADGVTIQGLQILNFPGNGIALIGQTSNSVIGGDAANAGNLLSGNGEAGVWLQNVGTTNNQVLGNYIGTDATGIAPLGNTTGLVILSGATDNIVGGQTANARNVISGNTQAGILIQNDETTGNQVLGNYIGTDATGIAPLGNTWGLVILAGGQDNVVGGDTAGAGNLISGNIEAGIQFQDDGTSGNEVRGNYIGTDVTGSSQLGNNDGIVIGFGADDNIIGGETVGTRNIISGNTETGIWLQNDGTSGNQILGNYIGTNVMGTSALGNRNGVVIGFDAQHNIIGGAGLARNLISGNTEGGIQIVTAGTTGNQVLGNYIGTDATGTTALGNSEGILIGFGAQNNVIGGASGGNLISGNTEAGILLQNEGTTDNQVLGNYIGTDLTGTAPLGNTWGIGIGFGAQNNVIGGTQATARNIISGNTNVGIQIQNDGTRGNQVLGNYIGTDAMGTSPLGNNDGVVIGFGAQDNLIGGETAGALNLISGNTEAGIAIQDTDSNQVLGNYIGTDVTGMERLDNTHGVVIFSGAQDNVIGGNTTGVRNVISGNREAGIFMANEGTSGNQVLGNYIGTAVTGTAPLSNTWGVVIGYEANNNMIGGTQATARNVISGNRYFGISIPDEGTTSNQVIGNYIGTDASGTAALGNGLAGIAIALGSQDNIVGGGTADVHNLISGNNGSGILIIHNGTSNNQVLGNYIGTDAFGFGAIPNLGSGIYLQEGADSNMIGISNTIAYNGEAGVAIEGEATLGNTITRNTIHDNGELPIDFIDAPSPLPGSFFCYSPLDHVLSGQTCQNCHVEIFANPTTEPAGTIFLNEVVADPQGNFTTTLNLPSDFPYLSATVTDIDGTTSEVIEVPVCKEPTPTPTPTAILSPTPTPTAILPPPLSTMIYLPFISK